MRNQLRNLLAEGQPCIGAQMRSGSPALAELFGCAGFDYLVFDAEHAPQTAPMILAQIQALASTSATPIIRVPGNDPSQFGIYLDMGAGGILAPLVKTPEEVEAGARACRYPPVGSRGYGPDRAARYGFDTDYFDEANDNVLYMAIIETAEAVDAIDEIMAVDGLDTYFVGPFDLSIALGVPRQFEHPRFVEAVEKVFAAAQRAGKPAGVNPDIGADATASLAEPLGRGYRMVLVDGDVWMLEAATRNVIGAFSAAKTATSIVFI